MRYPWLKNPNRKLPAVGPALPKLQITNHKLQIRERGYLLITLMLAFALMAIALLAILPEIKHQIKRDREEEMCHRGTMYMRAIQHYYKRYQNYPTRIEDLENSNNMRFLRKRYKDPMTRDPKTGKEADFKILHIQDVMLNNGPMLGAALGGAMGGGQGGLGGLAGGMQGLQGLAGGLQGQGGLQGLAGALGQGAGGLQGTGGLQGAGGLQNALGQMQQLGAMQTMGGMQSGVQNLNGSSSSDNSDSSNGSNGQGNSNSGSSNSGSSNSSNSGNGNSSSGGSSSPFGSQVFGGGPILGVASISKDTTIREYNKKNHYNDWYFIFDSSSSRGLLIGPWQPMMMMTGGGGIGTPVTAMGQGSGSSPQPNGGLGSSQSGSGFGFGQSPSTPNSPNQNQSNQQNPN